jgi:hypothetical protein
VQVFTVWVQNILSRAGLNKPVAQRNKKEPIFLRSLTLKLEARTIFGPTDITKDGRNGHAI